MNAGFSNLAKLKARVLMASDAEGTTYDAALTALGLGVVSLFEGYCDRKFAWSAEDAYEAPGDRSFVTLPRYPIASIASVEIRSDITDGYQVDSGLPQSFLPESGLVLFGFAPGIPGSTVRVTYAGGYWWDTTEDESGTLPAGAMPVPEALVTAHVLAVKYLWDRDSIENRAKAGFTDKETDRFISAESTLPLTVRSILDQYRRVA